MTSPQPITGLPEPSPTDEQQNAPPPNGESAPVAPGTDSMQKAARRFNTPKTTNDQQAWSAEIRPFGASMRPVPTEPPPGWSLEIATDRVGLKKGSPARARYAVYTRCTPRVRMHAGPSRAPQRCDARPKDSEYGSDQGEHSGVISPLWAQSVDPDPAVVPLAVGNLDGYTTMRSMAPTDRRSMVGYDTEFTQHKIPDAAEAVRVVESYQFCTPDPDDRDLMWDVVVLPMDGVRLRFSTGMLLVTRAAGLHRLAPDSFGPDGVSMTLGRVWASHDKENRRREYGSAEEAAQRSAWPAEAHGLRASMGADPRRRSGLWEDNKFGMGCGWDFSRWRFLKHSLRLCLVTHFGNADLTAFLDHPDEPDVMEVISAGGGLVSERPKHAISPGSTWRKAYPFVVDIRDTRAHAPAGMGSLAAIGKTCGVEKIDVPGSWKSRMNEYRAQHLADFLEYGANDTHICLEYMARLWGEGTLPPLTLSSAAARAYKDAAMDYLGARTTERFQAVFAGLKPVERGLVAVETETALTFYSSRDLEPLNGPAGIYQHMAAASYRGGYNGCSTIGRWTGPTWDLDLENAYTTAMAMVPDLDMRDPIRRTIGSENRPDPDEWYELTPADIPDPLTPFVGFVRFEFPKHVAYPCLPIPVSGSLAYPRSTHGLDGAYVQGPEVWLAMKIGGSVRCQHGLFGRVLRRAGGEPSRSLLPGARRFIEDRSRAKNEFGKGSLEELFFKNCGNSGYGKVSQDVSERHAWNAIAQEMDSVGGSAITSPHHAAMTTSLVRAMLLATMNQLADRP